jgi:hypothetical protein
MAENGQFSHPTETGNNRTGRTCSKTTASQHPLSSYLVDDNNPVSGEKLVKVADRQSNCNPEVVERETIIESGVSEEQCSNLVPVHAWVCTVRAWVLFVLGYCSCLGTCSSLGTFSSLGL